MLNNNNFRFSHYYTEYLVSVLIIKEITYTSSVSDMVTVDFTTCRKERAEELKVCLQEVSNQSMYL